LSVALLADLWAAQTEHESAALLAASSEAHSVGLLVVTTAEKAGWLVALMASHLAVSWALGRAVQSEFGLVGRLAGMTDFLSAAPSVDAKACSWVAKLAFVSVDLMAVPLAVRMAETVGR
jgi:hypothetical protein